MKIVLERQFALDAPFPKEYFLIVVVLISPLPSKHINLISISPKRNPLGEA
jgi:hypothetical protein